MKKSFRPAAVPLITVDPFFSVWSCADNLHDDTTRHWTEIPNPLMMGLYVDDRFYSMGVIDEDFVQVRKKMHQSNLKVSPLSSEYTFENDLAKVTVTFTTPLLLDRLDIMTRPASYVSYNIERKCDETHKIEFAFGINSRCCVANNKQTVSFKKTGYSVCCGNTVQNPLAQAGDLTVIDWGYLHLCDTSAKIVKFNGGFTSGNASELPMNNIYNPYLEMPYIAVRKSELSGVITLAYDEINPIEYFNTPLDEYYTNYFDSFGDMVNAAISEYSEIKKMCDEFDAKLLKDAENFGEDYQKILTIAYRQAVAAHKLVADKNGNLVFLSKECESNGCIGTLDVTYPSIPLFLKYNPELVNAMLRPILKFAKSDVWTYEFTPHDVGVYPIANGQLYGMFADKQKQLETQMPVEECGNMLLCLAAVSKFSGKKSELFDENKSLMKQWADYLVENGYNPGNQLCTDDFAGHLAHNCNLSLKAILGIAAYAVLSGDNSYMDIAKKFAADWEVDAKGSHGATRLTFDNPDGWSMKYNMVWDNLLELNLFSDEIKQNETKLYLSKLNRYGVPLDSRADYTKIDWLMWSTCIYNDKEYFDKVCESIVGMICETPDRVPLTDWYDTLTAKHLIFQNRSVVGGLFINLL